MKLNKPEGFLLKQTDYKKLFFYQKSDVLYQMTFAFCDRFIPLHGDRTRDQMIQAARSGKQNIVEGLADGVTSTEMMVKLINVARASLKELTEDYEDYLKAHGLALWDKSHPRYDGLLQFCREHNENDDYQPFYTKWSDEEYCNIALTLCHQTDRLIHAFLDKLEKEFVEKGGIKERMHQARTGFRSKQDEMMQQLKEENERLKNLLRENGIEF